MSEALRRTWAKDLDVQTLYELLKLRVEVFVVEQAIPYPELDGRDLLAETRHFWLERHDGEVICTLRLMEEHAGGEKVFRIGRLCTKRSARGQGHTTRLLRAAGLDHYSPDGVMVQDVYVAPVPLFFPFHHTETFTPECITDTTLAVHYWEKSWQKTIPLPLRVAQRTWRGVQQVTATCRAARR